MRRLVNLFLCLLLAGSVSLALPLSVRAASVAVTGLAKAANTGAFLNFNASPYNSNVTVDSSTLQFSGYAWSEDVGWLAFGATDNPSGAVTVTAFPGTVRGKAYAMSTGAYLDFNAAPYGSNVSISAAGTLSGMAWSEDLGWIDFSAPTLTLTSPNGGEHLNAGVSVAIVAASGGTIDHYRLYYSTDSGATYPNQIGGPYAALPTSFTVPNLANLPVGTVRLRIVALDAGDAVLTSVQSAADWTVTMGDVRLKGGTVRIKGGTVEVR